ncbi:P2Y purinoceptor 14-like [Protopterus annectens]|uniref:P2Y purinoceptor 14-like n=1 Tax=Protopterus annectens TaxID=7888 RepID=UPI001CFBF871|nr:P2Y purinoceptor 14-like [Protopterus annectens]
MNNSSLLSGKSEKCLGNYQQRFTTILLPILYSLLFLASLFLNSTAAWIFFKHANRKSLVILLKCVVVADLLMTMTLPFTILNHAQFAPKYTHFIVCRFSAIVFYTTMNISILFLALISLDRCVKIVKTTLGKLFQNPKFIQIISAVIWVVMFLSSAPNMFLYKKDTQISFTGCTQQKSDLGLKWHEFSTYFSFFIFWATFFLMAICYTKIIKAIYESNKNINARLSESKRKSRRNIFSVLGVFCVCFVPYHTCRIPFTLSQTQDVFTCKTYTTLLFIKEGTMFLAAMNICLDPIMYFLLCKSFTDSLHQEIKILKQKRSKLKQSSMPLSTIAAEKDNSQSNETRLSELT